MPIPRKNVLSLELNKAVLEAFRGKGIKYFGPLKTKWKFPYICPAVGQTEGILTSSVILIKLNDVNVRQTHLIETVRKKAVFINLHNFTYLEFDNNFKF